MTRTLVLAGGGAKGAYAFGCLKAFRDAGIQFDAVAGTSVGAINALLWSADALDEGEALWRDLSFATVYPVRFVDPRRHSRFTITCLAAVYLSVRLFWSSIGRVPTPGDTLWRTFAAILTASPIFLWSPVLGPNATHPHTYITVAFFAVAVLHWSALKSRTTNGLTVYVGHSGYVLCTTILVRIFPLIEKLHWSVASVLFLAVDFLVVLAIGITVMDVMEEICHDDHSILESAPLRIRISEILKTHHMRCPAFVVLASEKSLFDPDDPHWDTQQVSGAGFPIPGATWTPDPQKAWCPNYVRIDTFDPETSAAYCAASAALPFGIVPPIHIAGAQYVDGGVVDNCPVFPFYDDPTIDEIYVVLLEPHVSEAEAIAGAGLSAESWTTRNRLIKLASLPPPEAGSWDNIPHQRNKPPTIVPLIGPRHIPRLHVFCPSRDLGGFLRGTLNFDGRYAVELMTLGRADTLRKLNARHHAE